MLFAAILSRHDPVGTAVVCYRSTLVCLKLSRSISAYFARLFQMFFSHHVTFSIAHLGLSQTANKESGTCSVCLSTRQLHLKDGTVHQHGPRGNRCPGSDKLPLHVSDDRAAILASRSATCSDAASLPAPTYADSSSGCFQPSLPLPSNSGQLIRSSPSVSPTTPLPSHSVPSHPVLGAPHHQAHSQARQGCLCQQFGGYS